MRKAVGIDRSRHSHDSFTRMLIKRQGGLGRIRQGAGDQFKTAVADEIYKLTIKPIVVSVESSFAGGAAQAAGAAAGQSGSGIGGIVSGVQAAYSAVNGGISNAATAFATSGVGQWGPALPAASDGATDRSRGDGLYVIWRDDDESRKRPSRPAGWVAAIVAAIYAGSRCRRAAGPTTTAVRVIWRKSTKLPPSGVATTTACPA